MKLDRLTVLPQGTSRPIDKLEKPQLVELQTALNVLGYPAGEVDGLFGPKTRNAWAEFVEDTGAGDLTAIDGDWVAKLQKALGEVKAAPAHDFSTEAGTMKAIRSECMRQGIVLPTQIAYVLATADHETNHTFKPVTEAYWLHNPDAYLKEHHRDYYPDYGRGYVQLTWKNNYAKYGQLLDRMWLTIPHWPWSRRSPSSSWSTASRPERSRAGRSPTTSTLGRPIFATPAGASTASTRPTRSPTWRGSTGHLDDD